MQSLHAVFESAQVGFELEGTAIVETQHFVDAISEQQTTIQDRDGCVTKFPDQDDPAFNDAGPWDQTLLQMR
jgi:hypothetical protein